MLGRPGDAEPVAAALALALRRTTRSKAATVAVLGSAPTAAESGGSAAARRVTERLRAHGFAAHARGCLAWTHVEPASDRVIALAQRVTVVAAPAVFAVTASRTHDVDEIVSEQDLVVLVASDPQGPLAHLAAHGLGPDAPVVVVRPLRRGVGRALAWAGIRPARPITRLLGPQIDTGGGRA
ncbi:MAG TPA: hypothetical protein VNS09_17565 [Solirubrobacter sp.]|nr:hypothetical protein [Solirubrobacter sp.]